MFPCSIRRLSCSGDESTSSIWSAERTTQSGTRSRTAIPEIRSTASARLSRCWMFTVVMTEIPASISSSTSCQRFSWRPEPGTLVCASSSTRATVGFRARTASRSISSKVDPRYSATRPRDRLEPLAHLHGVLSAVALHESDHDVGSTLEPSLAFVQHGVGLADAGDCAKVDPETAGLLDDANCVLVDLGCRGAGHGHSLDPPVTSCITGAGPGGGLRSRHRTLPAENVHSLTREASPHVAGVFSRRFSASFSCRTSMLAEPRKPHCLPGSGADQ